MQRAAYFFPRDHWFKGSGGNRIVLFCPATIRRGMTIQIAFYDAYSSGPTDIFLCTDRAQPRLDLRTGELFKGRMDVFKIGSIGDECAISCGGTTVYQNMFLAKLLDLPPVQGDEIDYMDMLGRGQLRPHGMKFDTVRRAVTNVTMLLAPKLTLGAHARLTIVLCGRAGDGAPRIASWSTDDGLAELVTLPGKDLLIAPAGLTPDQSAGLLAAVACDKTTHDTQLNRAERAVSYCTSVAPIVVSQAFQYARLSQQFKIDDAVARAWPISSSACPSTGSCTSGKPSA